MGKQQVEQRCGELRIVVVEALADPGAQQSDGLDQALDVGIGAGCAAQWPRGRHFRIALGVFPAQGAQEHQLAFVLGKQPVHADSLSGQETFSIEYCCSEGRNTASKAIGSPSMAPFSSAVMANATRLMLSLPGRRVTSTLCRRGSWRSMASLTARQICCWSVSLVMHMPAKSIRP